MAFLDNSGDIILDAVLTDAGRQRMARGNFNIVKFAFGDEEINYQLYNSSHPSGSAFNDLEIMQTPILEAFTNNTSTMKSKLMTITNTNHLYLPTLRLNEKTKPFNNKNHVRMSTNMFGVAVDKTSVTAMVQANDNNVMAPGVMVGTTMDGTLPTNNGWIVIDQGMETSGERSVTEQLGSELLETQYIVQMDHRLGVIRSLSGATQNYSFVDDDDIATYYFGLGEGNGIVSLIDYFSGYTGTARDATIATEKSDITPYDGPLGTNVKFRIHASPLLRQSDLLFTEIGGGATTVNVATDSGDNATGFKYIDSLIRVTGVTTGYSIDLPVRFLKKPA
jgi:predicted ribosome-associated RNA-binding protein Tma20